MEGDISQDPTLSLFITMQSNLRDLVEVLQEVINALNSKPVLITVFDFVSSENMMITLPTVLEYIEYSWTWVPDTTM